MFVVSILLGVFGSWAAVALVSVSGLLLIRAGMSKVLDKPPFSSLI